MRTGERSPALVVRAPGDVVLEERDAPVPGPGEVLVQPDLVGLCGTDLEIIAGQVDPAYTRYPLGLGHEWTGIVRDWPRRRHAGGRRGRRAVRALRPLRARRDEPVRDLRRARLHPRRGRRRARGACRRRWCTPIAPGVAAEDAVLTEPASVVYRGADRQRRSRPAAGCW